MNSKTSKTSKISTMSKLNPNAPMFIPASVFKTLANGFTEKDIEADRAQEEKYMEIFMEHRAEANTYWGPDDMEDIPSKHRKLPMELQQAQCDALNNLKQNEIFKKKLTTFLEKEYCLDSINIEQGCRIDLNIRGVFDDGFILPGKKKKQIGFWFMYKQDNLIYSGVYECDDINDPSTGWFFQNICDDECGGTCSEFECATAYQRVERNEDKERSILMKKICEKQKIVFTPDIMRIYYDSEVQCVRANRYKRMMLFINAYKNVDDETNYL